MKLLTVADGFGDSKAVPDWYPGFYKWPEIIKFMTKNTEVINLSRYGAGNEYITNCIRLHAKDQDAVLVQWAMPNRLDLVLGQNKNYWQEQLRADSVYNNNVVSLNETEFWLSSASQNKNVQDYHKKYISIKQHQMRSHIFVEYVTLLLDQYDIKYKFLLSVDSDYLRESVSTFDQWCWHDLFKGMHSFRKLSQYSDLDLNLIQPISLVQFDFIQQYIMPILDLNWRSKRDINAVENMLYRKYKQALEAKPV